MSQRRIFPLQRYGNLLCTRASIRGDAMDPRLVRLLIDTGSSFTVIPLPVLEDLGYDTKTSSQSTNIMAAGGILRSPIVTVAEFCCLGQKIDGFSVVAMNVPFVSTLLQQLLGCGGITAQHGLGQLTIEVVGHGWT
jgi:predicted aspartyl protease